MSHDFQFSSIFAKSKDTKPRVVWSVKQEKGGKCLCLRWIVGLYHGRVPRMLAPSLPRWRCCCSDWICRGRRWVLIWVAVVLEVGWSRRNQTVRSRPLKKKPAHTEGLEAGWPRNHVPLLQLKQSERKTSNLPPYSEQKNASTQKYNPVKNIIGIKFAQLP